MWMTSWGPSVGTRLAGVAVVVIGIVIGIFTDGAGRLLVVPLVLGLGAAVLRAAVLAPFLAVNETHLRIVRGVTVHELEWSALHDAVVRRRRGRTLELEVDLEGLGEPSLVVLGPLSLGAEPSAVLSVLLAARDAALKA